jgi:ABC-2 type transport system ATP-binding protein
MVGERELVRLTGSWDGESVRRTLSDLGGVEIVQILDGLVILSAPDASMRLPAIFAAMSLAGAEIRDTTLTQPSLESLFIKLTGKELRE